MRTGSKFYERQERNQTFNISGPIRPPAMNHPDIPDHPGRAALLGLREARAMLDLTAAAVPGFDRTPSGAMLLAEVRPDLDALLIDLARDVRAGVEIEPDLADDAEGFVRTVRAALDAARREMEGG